MLRTSLAPLLLLLAAACASTSSSGARPAPPPRPEASKPYDARFPDPGTPLNVQVVSTADRAGTSVVEITYAGAPGAPPVQATLVRPGQGVPRGPAILWVHWLGDPATTNRTEFLEEAVQFARVGVTSLLVDALWSQPSWYKQRPRSSRSAAGWISCRGRRGWTRTGSAWSGTTSGE
jgi:hypothetical protein